MPEPAAGVARGNPATPAAVLPGMRTRLGTLAVLALLLGGCAQPDDTAGPTASDTPATSPSTTSPSPAPAEPTPVDGWEQVAILTSSAAGGRVSPMAVRLDTPEAIASFADQFTNPALGHQIRSASRRADLTGDQTLVGAVVTIGCAVPDALEVTSLGHRLRLEAGPIESSPPECLVAMTSVGLVAVPTSVAPPPRG